MKRSAVIVLLFIILTGIISCSKDYSIEGRSPDKAHGSWNFTSNSKLYNGNIDSSSFSVVSGTKVLYIQGPSILKDQIFHITLYTNDVFKVGSYNASASEVDFGLATVSKSLFQSDLISGEFTVNITNITSNTVSGTFSGTADDSTGAAVQVVQGNFASTIDLTNNVSGGSSVGTLGTTAGACTPATVSGTYTQNVTMGAGNTVQIEVNVTTPGTYSITTDNVNGVIFSGSGNFTSTGIQSVILSGTGTPTGTGAKTYTITYGSNNCIFNIVYN